MIEIIDNFLPEEEFNSIQSLIMGIEFGWFYTDGASYIDDGQYHMAHIFYEPLVGSNSKHIDIWKTFMKKVEAKNCTRIKVNLTFSTPTIEPTLFHNDFADMKTAVFYINTCIILEFIRPCKCKRCRGGWFENRNNTCCFF